MTIMKKKQLVKSNPWVIHKGVSQEARDIIKRLAKEKKVNIGEVLNDIIIKRDEESRVDSLKNFINQEVDPKFRESLKNWIIKEHGKEPVDVHNGMHYSHASHVDKTCNNETLQKLQELQANVYNTRMYNAACGNDKPFVLSFGALNQDDMDRKLIEHIYNRLRRNSSKEPVYLPDPENPWWKFWS